MVQISPFVLKLGMQSQGTSTRVCRAVRLWKVGWRKRTQWLRVVRMGRDLWFSKLKGSIFLNSRTTLSGTSWSTWRRPFCCPWKLGKLQARSQFPLSSLPLSSCSIGEDKEQLLPLILNSMLQRHKCKTPRAPIWTTNVWVVLSFLLGRRGFGF